MLKGILHPDDARKAIDAGAAAIVVSNHGGRTLDGAIPTAEILPEVAEAVDGRVELIVDGGIRRGGDVIRALALGARAVLVGRPFLWGLAINGAGRPGPRLRPAPARAGGGRPVLRDPRRDGRAARVSCGSARSDWADRAHHGDPGRHADPRPDHRPRLHRRGRWSGCRSWAGRTRPSSRAHLDRVIRPQLVGPRPAQARTSLGAADGRHPRPPLPDLDLVRRRHRHRPVGPHGQGRRAADPRPAGRRRADRDPALLERRRGLREDAREDGRGRHGRARPGLRRVQDPDGLGADPLRRRPGQGPRDGAPGAGRRSGRTSGSGSMPTAAIPWAPPSARVANSSGWASPTSRSRSPSTTWPACARSAGRSTSRSRPASSSSIAGTSATSSSGADPDILQPDIVDAGGISEVVRIFQLAEVFAKPVMPHSPSAGILSIASMHAYSTVLSAVRPHEYSVEYGPAPERDRRRCSRSRCSTTTASSGCRTGPGSG